MEDIFDGYKTLAEQCSAEIEEKKSRFIAKIRPVKTDEEAVEFINEVKKENRKARHNVYAYILREGNISRYSDDGEPQGTGGVPMLEVLKGEGLTDVCAVVTRYFGGILLGTGGLARAYSGTTKLAVDSGRIMLIRRCSEFTVSMGYELYGRISYLLPEYEVKTISEDFGADVVLKFLVRSELAGALYEKLVNAANGKIIIDEKKDLYRDLA